MISSHLISSEAAVFRSAMSTPTMLLVTIWLTEKDLKRQISLINTETHFPLITVVFQSH